MLLCIHHGCYTTSRPSYSDKQRTMLQPATSFSDSARFGGVSPTKNIDAVVNPPPCTVSPTQLLVNAMHALSTTKSQAPPDAWLARLLARACTLAAKGRVRPASEQHKHMTAAHQALAARGQLSRENARLFALALGRDGGLGPPMR